VPLCHLQSASSWAVSFCVAAGLLSYGGQKEVEGASTVRWIGGVLSLLHKGSGAPSRELPEGLSKELKMRASAAERPSQPSQLTALKMTDPTHSFTSLVTRKNTESSGDRWGAGSSKFICDISSGPHLWSAEHSDRLPFIHAFGVGPLHGFSLDGEWDLNRAAADFSGAIYRSQRHGRNDRPLSDWQKIIFQFGSQCFLCVESSRATVYDVTVEGAKEVASAFDHAYRIVETNPSGGFFQLLKVNYDVQCETVLLPESTALDEESFALHYGVHGLEWHAGFVERLRERDRGISIFEGSPGTGKTHYLRHLMSVLKETHRFYFLPPTNLHSLSQPEFIEFWSGQRRSYPHHRFVVILEDCESSIAPRTGENNDVVSMILSLSDGMLSDFLKIQIICTVNCRVTEIDQALLRPGRLNCHRVFPRLAYPEAKKLADTLGKRLPQSDDYSLAEIFAGASAAKPRRPSIGFGG
jgi:hypothetical protein